MGLMTEYRGKGGGEIIAFEDGTIEIAQWTTERKQAAKKWTEPLELVRWTWKV